MIFSKRVILGTNGTHNFVCHNEILVIVHTCSIVVTLYCAYSRKAIYDCLLTAFYLAYAVVFVKFYASLWL